MSKQGDKRRRAKYTLEFKLEAVRLVKGGQDAAVTHWPWPGSGASPRRA